MDQGDHEDAWKAEQRMHPVPTDEGPKFEEQRCHEGRKEEAIELAVNRGFISSPARRIGAERGVVTPDRIIQTTGLRRHERQRTRVSALLLDAQSRLLRHLDIQQLEGRQRHFAFRREEAVRKMHIPVFFDQLDLLNTAAADDEDSA